MIIIISISLSLSFSLFQLALRHSSWFSPRMHFLCVFSSPLVYHCFAVKLLNSFIGVSTLVTFLFERHGCVRGVVYVECVLQHFASLLSFVRAHLGLLRETDLFPLCSPTRPTLVHFSLVVFVRVGPADRKSATREVRYGSDQRRFCGIQI